MNYWWVNQNQTFKSEIAGGFLWSPKTRADGARNEFYDTMQRVRAGDIVFSFCDTKIKAVGLATGRAETSMKPDFGAAGANWAQDGWLIPIAFRLLKRQIRPKDHIEQLRPHLPGKYAPLQKNGDGLQSVYLAHVPEAMANVLVATIGSEYEQALAELQGSFDESDTSSDNEEEAIRGRTDIGATTKDQLIKSRRGQGVFRKNVQLNENRCRITGVTDLRHLRASHIKPWRDSTDQEKLDGCNGLLLAPHVDHLFDGLLISFSDAGDLMVSPRLNLSILRSWGIPPSINVGPFNREQCRYLEYHRQLMAKQK